MGDDDLCYLSATEAVGLFRKRALSPVELTGALIRRAEAIAPTVNPFADRYFDEALKAARKAEARYAGGKRVRALEGVTLGVKDSSAVKGRRATKGSAINADRIDDRTDPAIERLLAAGATALTR